MNAATHRRRRLAAGLAIAALLAAAGVVWLSLRPPPRVSGAGPALVGVNLAGGEFAPDDPDATYGRDYLYPDAKVAAPFLDRGMTAVRLPVRWERIQPWPLAMLSLNETRRLDAAIDALAGFDLVIVDLHNFAAYQGVRLSDDPRSSDLLADVWRRLAERYRHRPEIAFGLMNEPTGIDPHHWRRLADAAVAAIRATGATNLVLVPGAKWSGAHSWTEGGDASNAAALSGFADSNFAFEMHQYLDAGSGGQSADCVPPAAVTDRMAQATEWLRQQHARGFLAEFGSGASATCLSGLERLLDHVDDNADVWMGWTYWAGGPWWGDHWMAVQPRDGRPEPPQLSVVSRHVPGAGR